MTGAAALVAHLALLVALPPLLLGVIGRIKALAAGRTGPPLVQPDRDLLRLLRKGAVYSRTTTWVFRAGPIGALASAFVAGLLLPVASPGALLPFEGDLIFFAYLLGLGRFLGMAAALDTGSSFEGMGASREAALAVLAELSLFLALVVLCVQTGSLSLAGVFAGLAQAPATPPQILVVAALAGVLLAENARVPIDDPATHLELTMIHEVMVLDHSGPDLALLEYASAVKLLVTSAVLVGVAAPWAMGHPLHVAVGVLLVSVLVGAVESAMARLRLPRVKQFLIGSGALGAVALAASLLARGGA